ncbi:hypothetical protein EG329_013652 [Mollisiaceae sp. DMI_Dod_QoI]|nr:hypothetical protein EG329_013652 [Helotiales sp. DMI_Dod_QoI]
MQYGVLPGGGSPKIQKKSPARVVVGHLYNQVDLSRTASTLKEYIPNSITDVIAQYGDFEEQRWDDDVDPENATQRIIKKPKFHLLIPASKPTENLCKTLMSAAMLNYPPPTLISYGNTGHNERPGVDEVSNIFAFLHGKEAHDDDLILVVEEDAWFQLPAEVTINRYFHGLRDSNVKLLEKYGRVQHNDSTIVSSSQRQKYTMKILFGSAKQCSNGASDPACYSVPESPLPKDIYGDETDRHPEGKYNRPRYMSSAMVMGRVADLRPIYKEATEMLEFADIGKHGSQYVFSQIFGEQEYARTLSLASARNGPSKWRSWLSAVLSKPQDSLVNPPNITLKANKNYEYGIGLDYFSSIFQVMNNSVDDVRFVRFNHPSVIASPSRISAKAFKNPIQLPSDLGLAPPPFFQNQASSFNPDPPITELDNMHDDTALWTDIELSTNVIVPASSVPASLNFHGSEYLLHSEMWEKMWFHPNARALMRQYMRSPEGPIAAGAAADGGDKWWDLRGGKGGFWTDRGEWLEWNEVCGVFDDKIFGDRKGEFMREKEEVGGQKVVYKFGQLVEGKLPRVKTGNLDSHKGLLGEAMKAGAEINVSDGLQQDASMVKLENQDSNGTGRKAVKVGDDATIGDGVQVGQVATQPEEVKAHNSLLGETMKVGDGIKSGDRMEVGQPTHAGQGMQVEHDAQPGQDMQIGQEMDIGQGMTGGHNMALNVGDGMQVSGTMHVEEDMKPEESMVKTSTPGVEHDSNPIETHGEDNAMDGGKTEDEKKAEDILRATDGKEHDDSKSESIDEKKGLDEGKRVEKHQQTKVGEDDLVQKNN